MDSTPENTGLSPKEYERQKTAEGRVEDYAYTINHSLVCSVVDVFGTPVSTWAEKTFLGRTKAPEPKGHFWSWFFGEVLGDYLAVPVTVGFQRFAPSFMNGLRSVMEPILGPLFRFGARNAAKRWAEKNGIAADDPKVQERAQQIYAHEVRHLPQAFMWTLSSTAINLGVQYGIERTGAFGPKVGGSLRTWLWGKGVGKLASSALTAGAVVGVRGITPQTAEQWDHWTSRNVFLPVTEKIGHLIGVRKEDVERMHKKQEAIERGEVVKQTQWDGRLSAEPSTDRTVG